MMKRAPPAKPYALNARRLAVVEASFALMDVERTGFVPIQVLLATFRPERHPQVLDGNVPKSKLTESLQTFFQSFIERNEPVPLDAFVAYYTRISADVDRSREVFRDALFEKMVAPCWGLDIASLPSINPTGFRVSTLEMAEGLAAATNMDLVFPDLEGDGFCGFEAVVKNTFARKELPEALQGYFGLVEESKLQKVRYITAAATTERTVLGRGPAQAVLPYDLIWQDEATGAWTGLQAVIAAKIDISRLPETLLAAVVPPSVSAERKVQFLPQRAPFNPFYKKSSDAFGVGAVDAAKKTCEVKAAYYSGNGCGQVYCGHVGKFTDEFKGGVYSSSGLNTSTTRKMFD